MRANQDTVREKSQRVILTVDSGSNKVSSFSQILNYFYSQKYRI